jgi:TatD DNase family protein
LDYLYEHSPRDVQIKALEWQIDLALKHKVPIIFHVRDASSAERRGSVFRDFWSVIDNFKGIRGELHSFTDNRLNLEEGLKRGLLIGVNGISTFTKDTAQQELFRSIPLKSLLLETDAPFLTPVPFRGQSNEPAFVKNIAQYHASARGISFDELSRVTTTNARVLFGL